MQDELKIPCKKSPQPGSWSFAAMTFACFQSKAQNGPRNSSEVGWTGCNCDMLGHQQGLSFFHMFLYSTNHSNFLNEHDCSFVRLDACSEPENTLWLRPLQWSMTNGFWKHLQSQRFLVRWGVETPDCVFPSIPEEHAPMHHKQVWYVERFGSYLGIGVK